MAGEPGDDDETRANEGHSAVAAVAASQSPAPIAQENALAYFMGEEPAPNARQMFQLDIDFGTKGAPSFQRCTFTVPEREQLNASDLASRVEDRQMPSGFRSDPFVRWSYVFAYACVTPNLMEALSGRRAKLEEAAAGGDAGANEILKRLVDPAALVREVFRKSSGVLEAAVFRIEQRARIYDDPNTTVREVEAGKG